MNKNGCGISTAMRKETVLLFTKYAIIYKYLWYNYKSVNKIPGLSGINTERRRTLRTQRSKQLGKFV